MLLPEGGPGWVKQRPLPWNEQSGDYVGCRLFSIYKKLIQIRKDHPALRSPNFYPFPYNENGYGFFQEKDIVVYHRYGIARDGRLERFIIVINYSDFDQYITIPFSVNGPWDDLLNEESAFVENYQLVGQKINSNWGRIYFKKG